MRRQCRTNGTAGGGNGSGKVCGNGAWPEATRVQWQLANSFMPKCNQLLVNAPATAAVDVAGVAGVAASAADLSVRKRNFVCKLHSVYVCDRLSLCVCAQLCVQLCMSLCVCRCCLRLCLCLIVARLLQLSMTFYLPCSYCLYTFFSTFLFFYPSTFRSTFASIFTLYLSPLSPTSFPFLVCNFREFRL